MSSSIGEKIKLSIFGESHGEAVGCVIDGLPPGINLDMGNINTYLAQRRRKIAQVTTARNEPDIPHILSGIFNGYTTGAPLAVTFENNDVNSSSYQKEIMRPSHADYSANIKYNGFNDYRGGGHFSARLTLPLVFAGAIAIQILKQQGISIGAHIKQVGSINDNSYHFDICSKDLALPLYHGITLNEQAGGSMLGEIEQFSLKGDSLGGIVECAAIGLPPGIGAPMFDTLEGDIAKILFALPAVKGVEFGTGFALSTMSGSTANDCMQIENGKVAFKTNHSGGILGGISNGAPIIVRAAFKPTPSISLPQPTINLQNMQNETLAIKGRHDACVAIRALPVVQCAVAFALLNAIN